MAIIAQKCEYLAYFVRKQRPLVVKSEDLEKKLAKVYKKFIFSKCRKLSLIFVQKEQKMRSQSAECMKGR